jgi:phage gp45-like
MTTEFTLASEVTRAKIGAVDDSGDAQTVKVEGYKGESFSEVRRSQPHGFSSNPPDGAVGEFLRLGSSDRLVMIGAETPSRPKDLPRGASAFYNAFGIVWKLLTGKADLDHGGKNLHARNLGKYKVEASDWVQFDGTAVYLGKPPYFPVVTTGGPSEHVFAGIGPAAPDTPTGSV